MAVLGLVALVSAAAGAETQVDAFRTRIEKWVETRQILSQEQSDWEAERETLRATRDLLRDEKKALAAEIADLQASSTSADEEREGLLAKRDGYQGASEALEREIRDLEQQVKGLAKRLPDPLQKKLEMLLVQIPEDPDATRVQPGQRLMSVLGVLAQAEKWNGTANFVGETRPIGHKELQVRTLYWGLGEAFYVDSQGETAGFGYPTDGGWQFTNDPELAGRARQLLDIYEGNVDAIEFVELPVELH